MRVSLSWLREYVDLPVDVTPADIETALVNLGIEVDEVQDLRAAVDGALVVGRVADIEELTGFKKPIRFCRVDVGDANGTGELQEIVCGARNFAPGDRVVVILPGGVLPGGRLIRSWVCQSSSRGMKVPGRVAASSSPPVSAPTRPRGWRGPRIAARTAPPHTAA